MTDKAQKFWDRQAKKYDEIEKQFDPVYESVFVKTRKYLRAADNVLDFGCATGTKTIRLANGIKHIQGLDISSEMIHKAIKKKETTNCKNVSFSEGTIYSKDLKKASFDKITAFGIIQLLEDYESVIGRIYDLLKPGGLFISTTGCFKDKMAFKNALEFGAYRFMKRLAIFPLHFNMFMPADVEKLLRDQNFQILETETIFDGITSSFLIARKS